MAEPDVRLTLDALVGAVHNRATDLTEPELDRLATAVIHAGDLGRLADQLILHFMASARHAGVSRERLFAAPPGPRPRFLPRRHIAASDLEVKPKGVADPGPEVLPTLDELIDAVYDRTTTNDTELDRVAKARSQAEELWELADTLVGHFVTSARRAGASWAQILAAGNVTHRAPHWPKRDRTAERALMHAGHEAQRLGHHHIRTDHLLLGVTRESRATATRVLASLGVTSEALRIRIEAPTHAESRNEPDSRARPSSLPLTPLARRVLHEGASREAQKLGHQHIGTQHMILALAAEPEGLARAVLGEVGIAYQDLYERVIAIPQQDPGEG
jgi:hypothetical protein